MRNYIPTLQLIDTETPQNAAQDKLGGLPWGLGPEQWPKCRKCGHSQSFLAQFVHHPLRLDLGRVGRILSVFQCTHDPGMCDDWEAGSGGNACFVTEPDDLIAGLSALPADAPRIEREARIVAWTEREDGISEAEAALFWTRESLLTLPDEVPERALEITRLGSVPAWEQNPEDAPEGWRFLGQLECNYSFFGAPSGSIADVLEDPHRLNGRSHLCEGFNFGDLGIGYIFMRPGSEPPECCFFYQSG